LPCTGNILLKEIQADMFVFVEQDMKGAPSCTSGGLEYLQLQPDGTLSFRFQSILPSGMADILSFGVFNLKTP